MINGRSTWSLSMISGTFTSDAQILPKTLKEQDQTDIDYSFFKCDRELLSLAPRIFAPFISDNENHTTTYQHMLSKDLLMDNF